MQTNKFAAVISSLALLSACTQSGYPTAATAAVANAPQTSPVLPTPTVSDEMAQLLIGLLTDSINRPGTNALDTYAAAQHWDKNPPEFNALLNAKAGYHGMIGDHKIIIGGDGTNDVFAVNTNEGFDPSRAVAALKQVLSLKAEASDDEMGIHTDLYSISDHGRGRVQWF